MSPRGRSTTRVSGRWWPRSFEREDAELPGFVSIAPYRLLNPAAFGPGFLGPEYAPLVVGETGPGVVTRPREYDASAAEGRRPGAPAGCRPEAGRRPARVARRPDARLPGGASESGVAEPSFGLRPGGADDAFQGGRGVQPRRRARGAARRLRPEPVRAGLPAGPPAGGARGAVRRGRAVAGRRQPRRLPGTRTRRTSTRSRSSAACSTPPGRP